jgi:hypothetical protein
MPNPPELYRGTVAVVITTSRLADRHDERSVRAALSSMTTKTDRNDVRVGTSAPHGARMDCAAERRNRWTPLLVSHCARTPSVPPRQ